MAVVIKKVAEDIIETMAYMKNHPMMSEMFARTAATVMFGGSGSPLVTLIKFLSGIGRKEGVNPKDIQTPEALAKRYPTSAWERMGMVVGAGAATNYAQQTARNTGKLVELWARWVQPRGEGNMRTRAAIPARP